MPASKSSTSPGKDPAKITITDVSRAAGCSKSVVSAVVNKARGNISVSDATRERVLAAARRLGYQPNFASRSLARRSTKTIGLYVPPTPGASIGHPYEGRILLGVEHGCRKMGYDVLAINIGGGTTPEQCYAKFAEGRVDGLLMVHIPDDEDWVAPMLRHNSNIVSVNYFGNVKALLSIGYDNVGATRLAVKHLVGLGHRRIAYIGATEVDLGPGGLARYRGYVEAMAQHGLALRPDWAWDHAAPRFVADAVAPGWSLSATELAVAHFMTLPPQERPTAVVCYDDSLAVTTMNCLAEAGLRVPADVSVVGIDGSGLGDMVYPRLTSVVQPLEDMSQHATELLIERASERVAGREAERAPAADNGRGITPRTVWPASLIVRKSTAPPPGT